MGGRRQVRRTRLQALRWKWKLRVYPEGSHVIIFAFLPVYFEGVRDREM
jgi:hypothetical protein